MAERIEVRELQTARRCRKGKRLGTLMVKAELSHAPRRLAAAAQQRRGVYLRF